MQNLLSKFTFFVGQYGSTQKLIVQR